MSISDSSFESPGSALDVADILTTPSIADDIAESRDRLYSILEHGRRWSAQDLLDDSCLLKNRPDEPSRGLCLRFTQLRTSVW